MPILVMELKSNIAPKEFQVATFQILATKKPMFSQNLLVITKEYCCRSKSFLVQQFAFRLGFQYLNSEGYYWNDAYFSFCKGKPNFEINYKF